MTTWTSEDMSMKGKYQIYTLSLMIIICVIIGVTFMMSAAKLEEIYKAQTLESIQETKKAFLKETVNNLITDIDALRTDRKEYYATLLTKTSARIVSLSDVQNIDFTVIVKKYFDKTFSLNTWTVVMWNTDDNVAVYNPNSLPDADWEAAVQRLSDELAVSKIIKHGPYELLIGVSQDVIDSEVKLLIHDRVHQMTFSEDGYIWINQIVNYDGGDFYAFRVVHPNLPETEGTYLSTNTVDAKGNYHHLTELIGIKATGEVFNTYYFKKLNSDEVAKKLSYTKLYKPYDWAVGMGMYLDDLQAFTDKTNAESKALASRMIIGLILFFTVVVLLGFGVQISIERRSYILARSRLEDEANRDALTGVFNRRYGTSLMTELFEEFKKHGHSTMIMMFDIDRFKLINDNYGHDFGDETLIAVSRSLQILIRSTDTYIRWGGDEFVIIFTGLQKEMAEVVCHKVTDQVSTINLKSGSSTIKPTVSIGCAFFNEADKTFLEALKRVDTAMYQSKSEGPGRFTVTRE